MPDQATLPTMGGTVPKAEMVARLTTALAYFEAVDARLLALKQARVQLLAVVNDLQEKQFEWKASLIASLGRRSPLLAQYGVKPHVDRRAMTPEERVIRAEKARQTRKLRHTAGRRQKAALKFKGEVDVTSKLVPASDSSEVPPLRSG